MGAGRMRGKAAWGVIIAVLALVMGIRIARVYEPYTFLIGDCPYYTQAAISILTDGDLDLRNQLRGGLETHARQVSLGARGEWYPKHPVLMPLLTVPLLRALGMNAFLVFNVAVMLILAVALYELSCLAASPAAAAAGTLILILGSFLILYDYNYSPDLFACALLVLAVHAALAGRGAVSGAMAGLSALARTSNLFVLPLLGAYVLWKGGRRRAAAFTLAVIAPLSFQAALNKAMFESPFISPYMRILSIEEGRPAIRSHMNDFDNPLGRGISGQLLDREKGLLFTAPVLLLALPGFIVWFRRRPDQAILCLGVAEFIFLLFSRYRWWPTSHAGNRFLMPLLALSAPAVACSVESVLSRLRARLDTPDAEPHIVIGQ